MDIAVTPVAALQPTLQQLRGAWMAHRPDYAQRRDDLRRLRSAYKARLDDMAAAVSADFGHRSKHESLIGEGMTVLTEIDHMIAHLRQWMRKERRSAGWRLWPAHAEVRYVPVGVVGVISPWNYPVNLALVPLATAIAAGNHAYLKPSEHTPRTSEFLRELLAEVFPADRVAVALGGADVASAFAALPFDHLVFTGSTAVGRKVMAAAAANLTPLTLELGGKSPAVIGEDFPIAQAATRLATGKLLNAGQTCIAPDYVLVPQSRRDELVQALREEVARRYPEIDGNPDYTSIVNEAQYRRLRGYLDDARARHFEVIPLANVKDTARAEAERLLPPTLVIDPSDDAKLMQEEIFGPILPVKTYRTLDEAIAYINAHDRPLALYFFSRNRADTEKLLSQVVAGGVCINETLFHNACNSLPFGGIGPSGMGHYHGHDGFVTFSKMMPVLHQARWPLSDKLKPPYKGFAARMIDLLVR
ncbi:coniferyl-aldehyde dehydrogenase [Luteibacter rhizovicinus]|uniref:Aldehyde dehydrogenase n=1 Tax=Luteibacter rhizovicinus TaxID=242606 RepID=A0A4R3YKX6_9GAMM|nr:coniferyl aldehyde dehydrogenase [Luteibacter rhizovicinus]TCV93415.1 coniferyl-aldehyde dehydrogenase [Luteibacter rhizovicinus]